jgi:hypothetical protein
VLYDKGREFESVFAETLQPLGKPTWLSSTGTPLTVLSSSPPSATIAPPASNPRYPSTSNTNPSAKGGGLIHAADAQTLSLL